MKTAMEELIEWTNQYEGKMISADQVVLKAYKLIEKEKEQIMNAYCDGAKGGANGTKGQHEFGWVSRHTRKKYYNQTYEQQKQHIIDIMKADEDDGLYNQNK
jgi:hypothetical protein